MRLARAAIGIAAMGAGLVVARMIRRKGSAAEEPPPPAPRQLIGYPESHKDARESAEIFRETRQRPV